MPPLRGARARLRSRRDRRLRAEREVERIFELSATLLGVAGFDGYLRRFNPAFGTFGYSGEELLSRPWIDFAHPDDRERMLNAAASLAGGEDVVYLENRVVCRDGSVRWVEWSTRVVPEEELFYVAGRDVTQTRVAAQEQAALRRVATLVAQARAPEHVFGAVTEEVGRLLGVERADMLRYEPDRTTTHVASWSPGGPPAVPVEAMRLGGENAATRVWDTGAPVRIDSYAAATGAGGEYARVNGLGSSVAAPISVEGRLWGAVIAASKRERGLPPSAEERLAQFTALVAMAIANAEARAELTASRARIVATGDEARRRLRRDLHDGAQQRLVQTILELRLARQALDGSGDAQRMVEQALATAEAANAQLRELAQGILPGALSDAGIGGGIRDLLSRVGLPVSVDVTTERLPRTVEANAYFVVAEALTNVVKHASATRAHVAAEVDGEQLRLEISDDGVGGAHPGRGSGLVGLADRVEALGGELIITSPPGAGTALRVTLPLEPPETA